MKISLPSDSSQTMGGGFTFQRTLKKGLEKAGHSVTPDPLAADITLIAGTSMIRKESIRLWKEQGCKIIVRIDNVPRNSRNKNTGTSRLQGYSQMADEVVYQSLWAKNYLQDFIGKTGPVIYNGVDTAIFHSQQQGSYIDLHNEREHTYLYSRFNRDETKNWEVAWYKYQLLQMKDPKAKLIIVGKFSDELIQYNFDFFRGERIQYLGIVEDPIRMAQIMRSCKYFLATYFNDAFSNTYLEVLQCGMELYEPDLSGGTKEMIWVLHEYGLAHFSADRMTKEYLDILTSVLNR